jgi:sugar/nucleoside kinase (ribokinase family)
MLFLRVRAAEKTEEGRMASGICVAGIGEVLMDVFEDGTTRLGGAPLNASFHVHQLLSAAGSGEGVIVSAVGSDQRGELIRSSIGAASMSEEYVTVDPLHPSGTACVFEHLGQAGFEIQKDVAWDFLEFTPELEQLAKRSTAVIFGSLAQRSSKSRSTIQRFVSKVDGHRFYDVNLRRNTTDGAAGYSEQILRESCALASVIKMNREELEELATLFGLSPDDECSEEERVWLQMDHLRQEYSLAAVVVTRDAKGALLLSADKRLSLPDSSVPQDQVHPVGAGDAFSAGLLYGMIRGLTLEASLNLADMLSTWKVHYASATPLLSDDIRERVLAYVAESLGVSHLETGRAKRPSGSAEYEGRKAVQLENDEIRLTATVEGGHVAEILHKKTGINPLWAPTWRSVEPSVYDPQVYPEYGTSNEAQLVAGLLGHSLCLDLFGAPTPEEAAAGMPVHGEAPVALYQTEISEGSLTLYTTLEKAELSFERRIRLAPEGVIRFSEVVENHSHTDRPIGWTQHVSLGAPLLEKGATQFLLTATRSKVIESSFNNGLGMQKPAAEFDWPMCPRKDGGVDDLSTFTTQPVSGGFTAHLMDPLEKHAYFAAWHPRLKVLFGYAWRNEDFPWLARWEENHLRTWKPWNSQGFVLGMEFGVSPMVESRREMVARSKLFDTPTFRWIPAKSKVQVDYCAFLRQVEHMPAAIDWDGANRMQFVPKQEVFLNGGSAIHLVSTIGA